MAHNVGLARNKGLKVDTHPKENESSFEINQHARPDRPRLQGSQPSEDTIRATATPPIGIPGQHEEAIIDESLEQDTESYIQRYLNDRTVNLHDDTIAHRHSIPLEVNERTAQNNRGRSLAQALHEQKSFRAHSESEKTHYDPKTGRHLPQFSDSPPKEEAHTGEARFPLLQQTVDQLALRSFDPSSLTSASTMSPVEEAIVTPSDTTEQRYLSSPIDISSSKQFSTSYESPRPRNARKASERWREGESTAPDFFSRAGSLKKSANSLSRRNMRRDTGSTKSPTSAASSFLRGFSMSMHSDDTPPSVDAEGATVGDDYVLGKQIGFGGFSIIREVKQISNTGIQRTLAVKIVRKQIEGKSKSENDTAQADFEHEVDLWRLLNHKHILALEAVYEMEEATFCFVPLNTGGTLFDLISNNRSGLAPDLAVNYSHQLASALRYLHLDARVVHRDIKLENCLVDTSSGEPGLLRVCDFGVAEWISSDNESVTSSSPASSERVRRVSKERDRRTSNERTRKVSDERDGAMSNNRDRRASNEHRRLSNELQSQRSFNKYFGPAESSTSAFAGGSLEYASPEVLRIATSSGRITQAVPPEKIIVSPAVDIWALGVCVYSLVMGARPFQDAFQPRVVMAILAREWPKQKLRERDGGAFGVVRKCLREVERRAGIAEILEDDWFEGMESEGDNDRNGDWKL